MANLISDRESVKKIVRGILENNQSEISEEQLSDLVETILSGIDQSITPIVADTVQSLVDEKLKGFDKSIDTINGRITKSGEAYKKLVSDQKADTKKLDDTLTKTQAANKESSQAVKSAEETIKSAEETIQGLSDKVEKYDSALSTATDLLNSQSSKIESYEATLGVYDEKLQSAIFIIEAQDAKLAEYANRESNISSQMRGLSKDIDGLKSHIWEGGLHETIYDATDRAVRGQGKNMIGIYNQTLKAFKAMEARLENTKEVAENLRTAGEQISSVADQVQEFQERFEDVNETVGVLATEISKAPDNLQNVYDKMSDCTVGMKREQINAIREVASSQINRFSDKSELLITTCENGIYTLVNEGVSRIDSAASRIETKSDAETTRIAQMVQEFSQQVSRVASAGGSGDNSQSIASLAQNVDQLSKDIAELDKDQSGVSQLTAEVAKIKDLLDEVFYQLNLKAPKIENENSKNKNKKGDE